MIEKKLNKWICIFYFIKFGNILIVYPDLKGQESKDNV